MYEHFFGLRERPFELTPNPRFLLVTPKHREALINLEFGIASRKGVVMLVGEAGTGKTTVARALMSQPREGGARYIYLNNSALTRGEFLQFMARALGLTKRAETSKTALISELAEQLMLLRQSGRTLALMVDEAQSLSDELLEELRLLTNIETNDEKLLTLILIGQPRLATRLNDAAWTQLKQRIEIRATLTSFTLSETMAYIWNRIRTAGGDGSRLFTAEAVHLIHERSHGIPRSINVICENALVSGFAEHEQPVTRRLVLQVCHELDLHEPSTAGPGGNGHDHAPGPSHTSVFDIPGAPPSAPPLSHPTPAAVNVVAAPAAVQTRRRWWPLSKVGLPS